MDLSRHIKDLITAYESMPQSPRRERIIKLLHESYLLATSDGLESVLHTKSTQSADAQNKTLKSPLNGSEHLPQTAARQLSEFYTKGDL